MDKGPTQISHWRHRLPIHQGLVRMPVDMSADILHGERTRLSPQSASVNRIPVRPPASHPAKLTLSAQLLSQTCLQTIQ